MGEIDLLQSIARKLPALYLIISISIDYSCEDWTLYVDGHINVGNMK